MKKDSYVVLEKRVQVLNGRIDDLRKSIKSFQEQNKYIAIKYESLIADYKHLENMYKQSLKIIKDKEEKEKKEGLFDWLK